MTSLFLIATNYHVIQGADTVSVTCIDGEVYEAIVNGYDADKDLAVVSVCVFLIFPRYHGADRGCHSGKLR